jgi:PAS domain S-box-containing protein
MVEQNNSTQASQGSTLLAGALMQHAPQATVVLTADALIREILGNPGALGYQRADLLGRNVMDLIHPDEARAAEQGRWLANLIDKPDQVLRVEHRIRHRRGTWHVFESLIKNCLDEPTIAGLVVCIRPATWLGRMRQRLRQYRQTLRDLCQELTLSDEHQRQTIASDLHDDLAQTLALAKMRLDALRDTTPAGHTATALDEVIGLIRGASETTRAVALDLSPPILLESDLHTALRCLADQIAARYGLKIQIERHGEDVAIPQVLRILLYRAVRELLINVAKHADVDAARVELYRNRQAVRITVADLGAGFDATMLSAQRSASPSMGIRSVRRRIESVDGRLEIRSQPGQGTLMTLILPLGG